MEKNSLNLWPAGSKPKKRPALTWWDIQGGTVNKTLGLVAIWGAVGAIGFKEPGAGVAAAIFGLFATVVVCRS